MTLTATDPARHDLFASDADVEQLLRTTSVAVDDVLRCVLDDDRGGAHRVGHDGARRRVLRAAHDQLEREGRRGRAEAGGLRRLMCRLQFIEDLITINALVDRLAELVTEGYVGRVPAPERRDLRLLREAGSQRLRQLAAEGGAPVWDIRYRRCGEDLHDVLSDLGDHDDGPEPSVLCGRLAATVLAASRHAAGAA